MQGLYWVTVGLAFFLSVQNTLAAVDKNWLSNIVQTIRNKYELDGPYIWAVNIPENQDPSRLMGVLQDDPPDTVIKAVSKGDVYQGKRMTASTQSLSISHVLEKIKFSKTSNQGNTLIIYSQKYPNENGIAANINKVIQNWGSYAFVFSKVVDVADAGIPERTELFKQQELSKLGLENIFRCYELGGSFQCTSCSSVENVAPSCVADTLSSNDVTGLEKRTFKQGRKSGRARTGGRRTNSGEVRGAGRRTKGGNVGKGGICKIHTKVGGGGKSTKGGKVGKGGSRTKGGKVGKAGRSSKGGKVGKAGRSSKGSNVGKGGRSSKGGKVGKGGRSSKGGKGRGRGGRGGRGQRRR